MALSVKCFCFRSLYMLLGSSMSHFRLYGASCCCRLNSMDHSLVNSFVDVKEEGCSSCSSSAGLVRRWPDRWLVQQMHIAASMVRLASGKRWELAVWFRKTAGRPHRPHSPRPPPTSTAWSACSTTRRCRIRSGGAANARRGPVGAGTRA